MATDHSIRKRVNGEINRIAVGAGDGDGDGDSSSINCTASRGAGISVAAQLKYYQRTTLCLKRAGVSWVDAMAYRRGIVGTGEVC
jgi:hypothetical protein